MTNETKQEQTNKIVYNLTSKDARTHKVVKTLINPNTGEAEECEFVYQVPSLATRVRIGQMRSSLLGSNTLESFDITTLNLTYLLAYLSCTIIKKPIWVSFEELYDINFLQDMYDEVIDFANRFQDNYQSYINGDSLQK